MSAVSIPTQAPERYFFSVRYRDRLMPDREGVELPAGSDLEACAKFLATRLERDGALAETNLDGCAVEVTDSRGRKLETVFLETAKDR